MGANSSKPSDSAPTHVWKGSSPASVSQDMLESLQTSTETDTSRAQLAEAQVQARVAAELRKLEADASARLSQQLTGSLLDPSPDSDSSSDSSPNDNTSSRQQVTREIEALRRRLETRRVVRDVPTAVEAARSDVVRCLREHDRRPLDCWREVEAFREQVRRLEKGWVERVVS